MFSIPLPSWFGYLYVLSFLLAVAFFIFLMYILGISEKIKQVYFNISDSFRGVSWKKGNVFYVLKNVFILLCIIALILALAFPLSLFFAFINLIIISSITYPFR